MTLILSQPVFPLGRTSYFFKWAIFRVIFWVVYLMTIVLKRSTNNFAHAQTLYRMNSLCRSYECMNIVRVNIGIFIGYKKIKQRRISFVLGYLRMILWKCSTTISIKHRILATFKIKIKSILTACMPLSRTKFHYSISNWMRK